MTQRIAIADQVPRDDLDRATNVLQSLVRNRLDIPFRSDGLRRRTIAVDERMTQNARTQFADDGLNVVARSEVIGFARLRGHVADIDHRALRPADSLDYAVHAEIGK